ncbi:MAG: hypothetical protein ABW042_09040, partial [Phenylobacterium sp.]
YGVYRFGPRWPAPGTGAPEAAFAPPAMDRDALLSLAADAEAIAVQGLNLEEIEALADARNGGPGAERDLTPEADGQSGLARARLMVVTGGGGTGEDLEAVAAEVARLPPFVLSRFEARKLRVVACRGSVTDFEADLRGKTPRGWEGLGRTWDDVPGAYLPDRKRVVIATIEQGGARVVPSKASGLHGSASLAVHECLHGYDYIGDHAALRDPGFLAARQGDLSRLGAYEQQSGQPGLEETYAESGARFAAEPAVMQGDWPNLHGFWGRQIGGGAPESVRLEPEPALRPVAQPALGTVEVGPDGALLLDLRAQGEGGAIGHALLRIAPGDPAHGVLQAELALQPELARQGAGSARLFRPGGRPEAGNPPIGRSRPWLESNPLSFVRTAELAEAAVAEAERDLQPLDLDQLPNGVVCGTTLIDFTNVASPNVRAGVALAMLFASRVASKAMQTGDDEDDWLAAYTSNLGQLGFSLTQSSVVQSRFKKTGVAVHQAIIPFLTLAFGGAAVGPVILEGLRRLQARDEGSPWIALFDRETRRFDIRELHFAAVSSDALQTSVRYAVARLNVKAEHTSVLFFKLSKDDAQFESVTRTMSADNSLLAVIEPDLRERLGVMSKAFIVAADL